MLSGAGVQSITAKTGRNGCGKKLDADKWYDAMELTGGIMHDKNFFAYLRVGGRRKENLKCQIKSLPLMVRA
jgi:hypothetical protein